MYCVTEYPYFKTTGISLFLHGALLAALLVLRPFATEQPPVITAVEIVSVTEPEAPEPGAAISEASPPPAPPAMAQPTPQTPAPAQPLPPTVPDELSTTPTAQPVFAGSTTAASEPSAFAFAATGIPGGSGTVATATDSGTQVGSKGNGSGERTRGSSVYAPKPRYPQAARRDGWEGNVLLHIRVETDGSVTVLSVLEGGRSDIEESAVETVNQWRYSPDRDENGEPIVASKNIRIKFNLNDVE
ncbi:hypothetical protein SPSIL_012040 [Sporomusa silvacetica DSM 10669]|uniref:TonB C-terminal domain-containing protein n=1 Tax=Sporomusa silvacetica DSM 10669 TaxID=1123289 RepID=A0ABZ3IHE6_9FIRM|nr:energy transducer TonB [Sporomusa silvacetica]OZC22056.1 transport protein TonB [Sporomusa silvacetica DSM 10669]